VGGDSDRGDKPGNIATVIKSAPSKGRGGFGGETGGRGGKELLSPRAWRRGKTERNRKYGRTPQKNAEKKKK